MEKQKDHSIQFINDFKKPNDEIIIFDAIINKDKAIGCKASHLEVLKQINDKYIHDGINRINYIFEDDVALVKNSRAIAEEFISKYRADILYLGYCYDQFPTNVGHVGGLEVIKLSTPRCTHAYIIESKSAKGLIDLINNDRVDNPIDEIIGRSIFDGKNTGYGIDLFKQPWQVETNK
jgi:GR25 family glycosyltransferase involved in LPS biosynthesis